MLPATLLVASGDGRGETLGNFPLLWSSEHARLHVLDEHGAEILPFEGQSFLMVPGFSFSRDGIGLVPGKQRIWFACPPGADGIAVNDLTPSVDFDFVAGKDYDLRCSDGEPVITERPAQRLSP